jgi:hypothetical protein
MHSIYGTSTKNAEESPESLAWNIVQVHNNIISHSQFPEFTLKEILSANGNIEKSSLDFTSLE